MDIKIPNDCWIFKVVEVISDFTPRILFSILITFSLVFLFAVIIPPIIQITPKIIISLSIQDKYDLVIQKINKPFIEEGIDVWFN